MYIFKLLILIFFIFFNVKKASASEAFDYPWTNKHPVLTKYYNDNKSHILRNAPQSNIKIREYRQFMEEVMKAADVPKELIVLPAIESSFNPYAVSHAGATGMWQFMSGTAKDMGLIQNGIDKRKNWKASTIAAAKYLKWLAEEEFDGDYELAIIAYNAGVGKVKNGIKKFKTRDPWKLIQYSYFSKETRDYLPKFVTYVHLFYYFEKSGKIPNPQQFNNSYYAANSKYKSKKETYNTYTHRLSKNKKQTVQKPKTYKQVLYVKQNNRLVPVAQRTVSTPSNNVYKRRLGNTYPKKQSNKDN